RDAARRPVRTTERALQVDVYAASLRQERRRLEGPGRPAALRGVRRDDPGLDGELRLQLPVPEPPAARRDQQADRNDRTDGLRRAVGGRLNRHPARGGPVPASWLYRKPGAVPPQRSRRG